MFWLVAIGIALVATLFVLQPLLMTRIETVDDTGEDMAFYKGQLHQVDRDLARGLINKTEAEALRLDISKRLLSLDAHRPAARQAMDKRTRYAVAGLLGVALIGGALWLYAGLGSVGLQDQPLAERRAAIEDARLSQSEAEARVPDQTREVDAESAALIQRLRDAVAQRPDDREGLRLLAGQEAQLGNFIAAYRAQEQLITALGDNVAAADFGALAEYMIFAAGGIVSPEAQGVLTEALALDPEAPRPRYYSGLAMAQTGRSDLAAQIWRSLISDAPEGAPWVDVVRQDLAALTGEAPLAGPNAADIEAAGDLSAQERDEMIRGMVSSLGERLALEGGSAQEWAQLIRALGVLGETAQANAIWQEAQDVFAQDEGALRLLRDAAQDAEVAQ